MYKLTFLFLVLTYSFFSTAAHSGGGENTGMSAKSTRNHKSSNK